jgi:hypothetical protein
LNKVEKWVHPLLGESRLKTGALWVVLGVWENGWENKAGGDIQMSTLTPFPVERDIIR